ncbi:MAG: hypothetical protein QNJ46_03890 [Leptolyngbyaceae cyanobacterium MO_188.B28]|nr:hypothetical protein [Leptolyngbyaceae cyanobacterium MO_188.B28]
MPILILDDLRRAANNRKIPNADTLDFKQLLQALANQSERMKSQTNYPTENQKACRLDSGSFLP